MAVADQVITNRFALYNGDCVEVMKSLPDKSVKLSVYSPPFGGLYNYSSDPRDMSNCDSYAQFFDHYAYVIRELHRLTLPGRVSAVHVADVPSGNTGHDHLRDFSGDVIRAHEREGWHYAARYSIWKEPLDVYLRTMAKNLQHRSLTEDSARCSCAAADYLLIFRKPGENQEPVVHPTGLMEYIGAREVPESLLKYRGHAGKQTENRYSQWVWRNYASAFWDDIRIGNVLPFRDCKEPDDEKHVHPLQLDVIERSVILWSNPGDTVLTPFMGVGSEVYGAVKHGRRGIGAELKSSYYRQAVANVSSLSDGRLSAVASQDRQVSMFDTMDEPA